MKKFFFIFRSHLTVNYYSFIRQLFGSVIIFAFIIFPCFAYSASSDSGDEIKESIIEQPQFFKTDIPGFEHILFIAVPEDVMLKNAESINQGTFSGSITTIPIQANSNKATHNRTEKTREDYAYVHPFLFLLSSGIGFLMGPPIAFLIVLCAVGHLEHLFHVSTLRKLRVPKFLYVDY
jgi:hypothetical protein